ncbi:MAG: YeeE/YedE thiosulfate transporter family protein [Chloroflexi bacterium]|nr:YeeE/YedE thiosulfate transporter family protein [Chloroflexota bacterium]
MDILPDRLPWFVVGPSIGLLVVALYALANQRLGVTGSYVQIMGAAQGRPFVERWRIWFFGGLAAGSFIAALLRGGPSIGLGYGALALVAPLGVLVPLLFVGGMLMGYGARWSGGCTSGHGIGGTSSLSPASFAATAAFMATAIGVTFLLHVVTGGAL